MLLNVHTYAYVNVEVYVIERVVLVLQLCRGLGQANRPPPLHELIVELVCRKKLLAIGGDIIIHMPHA